MGAKQTFHKVTSKDDGVTTHSVQALKSDGTQVKLSDFLKTLPCGVFDKGVTGLGGTTMELDAKRPSIIVEPLNVTAHSKAQKPSRTNKFEVFYFGTIKDQVQTTSEVLSFLAPMQSRLSKYLKACKEKDSYPKITCVSDQLQNLKETIETTSYYSFQDFHLLLDEIDSMQEQIGFRNVMQDCIDLYKSHPKRRRTLLSATLHTFHDPELAKEATTRVVMNNNPKTAVTIHQSANHPFRITQLIIELLKQDSETKIMVAQNHLEGIENSIQLLEGHGVGSEDIKVLCSLASKDRFSAYYDTISDDVLPGRINFITAAYFSGFDLHEQAHVIMSVDARNFTLQLGNTTLYQIQGRLRLGVKECHIVTHFVARDKRKQVTSETVLDAVSELQPILEAYNTCKNSKNKFVQKHAKAIRNIYTNGYDGIRSIWTTNNDQIEVSYLKIDNLIQENAVRQSLTSYDSFKEDLAKYFDIVDTKIWDDPAVKKEKETLDNVLSVFRTIGSLDLRNPKDKEYIKEQMKGKKSGPSKTLLQTALSACGKEVFLLDSFLSTIEERLTTSKNWSSELDAIALHVEFHSLLTGGVTAHKNYLSHNFSKLEELTSTSFKEYVQECITELASIHELEGSEYGRMVKKFNTPLKFMKTLLSLNDRRNNKVTFKRVISLNPFGLLDTSTFKDLDIDHVRSGVELHPKENDLILLSL